MLRWCSLAIRMDTFLRAKQEFGAHVAAAAGNALPGDARPVLGGRAAARPRGLGPETHNCEPCIQRLSMPSSQSHTAWQMAHFFARFLRGFLAPAAR